MQGMRVPSVIFKTRVRDDSLGGTNPFKWVDMGATDIFSEGRQVLFSLPGAFTPTCSTYQLPGFERLAGEFKSCGVSDIYCLSVNDSFVMNAWAKDQNLKEVKVLPDGSGEFTRYMGMLIDKCHLGFGLRSWRYAAVFKDGFVEAWFQEPGINNTGADSDPYGETKPENILSWLKANP